jgi:hypothetical protein
MVMLNSLSRYACFLFAMSNTWCITIASIATTKLHHSPGEITQLATSRGISENIDMVLGLASGLQHSSIESASF